MSNENIKTIATYRTGVKKYINRTPNDVDGNQKLWIDQIFSNIEKSSEILEIGSASGRDARYLMQSGYNVELSDATPEFVEYLRIQGLDAQVLNIVSSHPDKRYDVVYASAVFLHFTEEDFDTAVNNVRHGLNSNGKFVFSVKQGHGDGWSNEKMDSPRYFKYWQEHELVERLTSLGMRVTETISSDDKWIWIVAEKTS